MRTRAAASLAVIAFLLGGLTWYVISGRQRARGPAPTGLSDSAQVSTAASPAIGQGAPDSAATNVYAHNLLLRKGPNFRFYVRWLRGQLGRTHRNVNPSFDDTGSFFLDIKSGVLRANIGDIGNFLSASSEANSPLKNIKLLADGDHLKLTGTMHKLITFSIALTGSVSALPDNRIKVHVTKIDVSKIPLKGLFGMFHVNLADLFQPKGMAGVEVSGNDVLFDTTQLLPPPHIRGHLTNIRVVSPDLEEVYGDAEGDVTRVQEWRNFIQLAGGTIDFGKLTMRHVDLIMIDISKDPWFDMDLSNYQTQLVNGYTHMTPQAGLQIFMPDLRDVPVTKVNKEISIEWFKNRNIPPPLSVYSK